MENKITDINCLVTFLVAMAMKPVLNDDVWQCYGYKKRPVKGAIWTKLFPKMFALDTLISREILRMGLIDVLNGIKKSNVPNDIKLLIVVGVIDQFLTTTKDMLNTEDFMQNLFSSYALYLKSGKTKLHESILKLKDVLDKKDFAKFIAGTFKILGTDHANDFLLKSDYIKNMIEKSSKNGKLKISMSDEMYKKYVSLLEEKILNA